MEIKTAITLFAALSQDTRLQAFRLLVEAGPSGMPAGAISERLNTPHNTLSFHLSHLQHAGLVSSRKEGRSVIYSANYEAMRELLAFLVEDCCRADIASIREDAGAGCSIIELANCCPQTSTPS
ncbi:MAG: metalloregulator ArsR/SmtB family transcription factor [Gammaproteobacteria bacterium]